MARDTPNCRAPAGVWGYRSDHRHRRTHEVQCHVPALPRHWQKHNNLLPPVTAKGSVEKTEPLEVRIKPGTRDGQRIRIPGKGNAGEHGGPAGDLYVIIRTADHPIFHREGDDIHLTVPVTVTEAALGAKVEVPTIDGRAMLKIPPELNPVRSFDCARRASRRPQKTAHEGMRSRKILTSLSNTKVHKGHHFFLCEPCGSYVVDAFHYSSTLPTAHIFSEKCCILVNLP